MKKTQAAVSMTLLGPGVMLIETMYRAAGPSEIHPSSMLFSLEVALPEVEFVSPALYGDLVLEHFQRFDQHLLGDPVGALVNV